MHTSVLDHLCWLLCNAVMEQEGSQALLEALERANLFVVPLDDERAWYRYHHLFAEVLRRHLEQAEPKERSRNTGSVCGHDLGARIGIRTLFSPRVYRVNSLEGVTG